MLSRRPLRTFTIALAVAAVTYVGWIATVEQPVWGRVIGYVSLAAWVLAIVTLVGAVVQWVGRRRR